MSIEYQMRTYREKTLSSRNQPKQELPQCFPDILKEYAREVLRAQPDDILSWSAQYFKQLALEKDPLQVMQPPPEHYAPVVEDQEREMLAQHLEKAFCTSDSEATGRLPVSIVKRIMLETMELSISQTLYILTASNVEISEDNTIEYNPFAREAVRAVQYFKDTGYEFAVGDLTGATVHGLTREDVEQEFLRIFRMLDESGTGHLPFVQYRDALVNAPFHLTRRDIRMLCLECDRIIETDEVVYEKEIPRFFDLLILTEQFDLFDEENE